MIGFAGKALLNAAFISALLALTGYFSYSKNLKKRILWAANSFFALSGLFVLIASGLLLYIIVTHQFNYFYPYNYTSLDLSFKYLISAFWGGQEGSFVLWILFTSIIGLILMKWVREPYRGPVLFFFTLNLVFLLSMVIGVDLGFATIGASPFRTLAEAMADAPFIQANPGFVPADGKGLNDMLKSPWMVLHPPALFMGFTLMSIPFCFAMAALWKRKYREWTTIALPWTLAANLSLFIAIFVGGYWAYVTLSFGGYWAWDPVENASLIPWLIGTAGIHAMLIQRKKGTAPKSALILSVLAYAAVIYETFLTRSGILADASVHSFVDLGLYNLLLAFIVMILGVSGILLLARYKDLRRVDVETDYLSWEFFTNTGILILFLIGVVVTLGTSSPIIGRLFHANPTPPEISFYNNWTMPLAIMAALLTVVGTFLFWKKQSIESLSSKLLPPLILSSLAALATVFIANIRNSYYLLYIFSGWFVLFGNGISMWRRFRKHPRLIGGALSHIGFGILLLGFLASSVFETGLLDRSIRQYNTAIRQGKVKDEDGRLVMQPVNYLELKLDKPKLVNGKYLVTYEGYTLRGQDRPGQQEYAVKFQRVDHEGNPGKPFYLRPQVYPMLRSSSTGNINWTVDVDVHSGFLRDIYLYVAGSSYVERKNNQAKRDKARREQKRIQPAGLDLPGGRQDSVEVQKINLARDDSIRVGDYQFRFMDYSPADPRELPDSTSLGVHAVLKVQYKADKDPYILRPLFAIYRFKDQNWIYSPPLELPEHDIEVQFSNVETESGKIELTLKGISQKPKEEWILLTGREKPFVSLVWLGTFILLTGFGISSYRHGRRSIM